MKTVKKHCLIPTEAAKGGINGHSAFYCFVNNILVSSNNDILGNKWYIDTGKGEGSNTIWYPSPTIAAIAYYDRQHKIN